MGIPKKTTKELIFESYLDLWGSVSFDKIRVSSICKNCGIDRQQFYYYFEDKYDLVTQLFYKSQLRVIDECLEEGCSYQAIVDRYVDNILTLTGTAMSGKSLYGFNFSNVNSLFRHVEEVTSKIFGACVREENMSDEELQQYSTFCYACFGALLRWFLNGYSKNCDEVKNCLYHVPAFMRDKYVPAGEA